MGIGFKGMHPASTFIFFVFTFVFSMISSHPILLALSFLCGLVYDIKLHKEKAVSFFLHAILPLVILITLFNFLFSHYGVTILYETKGGNDFTLEPLVFGFVFAIKASSTLLWLDCFNEIVTGDKFIYLFGRFSPKFALVISMVLRFIPLIRTQSEEISRAEKGIGISSGSDGFVNKIRSAARRLSVLVSWTLEKGIDTSDSMSARGYGLSGRTSYDSYIFSKKDILLTVLSLVAFAGSLIINGKLNATYNPVIDITLPDTASIIAIMYFTVILFVPTFTDLTEERKWSISK